VLLNPTTPHDKVDGRTWISARRRGHRPSRGFMWPAGPAVGQSRRMLERYEHPHADTEQAVRTFFRKRDQERARRRAHLVLRRRSRNVTVELVRVAPHNAAYPRYRDTIHKFAADVVTLERMVAGADYRAARYNWPAAA
jgi:hypothetical protein